MMPVSNSGVDASMAHRLAVPARACAQSGPSMNVDQRARERLPRVDA